MTATLDLTAPAAPAAPTLDERLVRDATGALELFGVYLGDRLGLYAVLRDRACTEAELADAAGIAVRYAREWLEQQAVAGLLVVDDAAAPAEQRRYALPEEHVGVLAEPTALDHVAPLARMVAGIGAVLDEVVTAYRTGGGVPYSHYGADFRSGQGGVNRPAFSSALVEEWLPALGPVAQRLASGGRLLDVGCGQGWSTTAIAKAYPAARVTGVDLDPGSIDDARAAARAAGIAVEFACADAADLPVDGGYDVITFLEALHDCARPVEVLSQLRASLSADGVLLVADEAVAPEFSAPGDEIERFMYGWSITHCLPAAVAEQPADGSGAAIGTVIRESTVRELAAQAGLDVEVLDVDGGFFRLYAMRPAGTATSQTSAGSGR